MRLLNIESGSSVTLGNLLDFFSLSDCVGGLGVATGGVDDLVGQALSNGLGGLEGMLSGSVGDQVDTEVDSSQG